MKAEDISDDQIKEIAEYIIVGETEDIEYLTVAELTDYKMGIDFNSEDDIDEREKVWRRVDAMIGKATVTVTFEE